MALERKLALDGGATTDSDGFVSVSCSYDKLWDDRRGARGIIHPQGMEQLWD